MKANLRCVGATQTPAEKLDAALNGLPPQDAREAFWPALHALACPDESLSTFRDRWGMFGGARELWKSPGKAIIDWMSLNLLRMLKNERGLYGTKIKGALDPCALASLLETQTANFDRTMDIHSRRADDVERLGGDVERVSVARSLMAQEKDLLLERRELFITKNKARSDKMRADQAKARIKDLARWRMPAAGELERTPKWGLEIGYWHPVQDAKGEIYWSAGTIIDFVSTPPDRWVAEKIRNLPDYPDISPLLARGNEPLEAGTVIGVYELPLKRRWSLQSSVVALAFGDRVHGLNIGAVRYFLHTYADARFFRQGDGLPVLVIDGIGRKVGLVAPVGCMTDALGELRTPADVAERFRMLDAGLPETE